MRAYLLQTAAREPKLLLLALHKSESFSGPLFGQNLFCGRFEGMGVDVTYTTWSEMAKASFFQSTALKSFSAVDEAQTGRVDARQLQHALASDSLLFSLRLCTSLIRMHDTSGSGWLDLTEFAVLHQYLQKLRDTFVERSGAGGERGSINLPQCATALQSLGHCLDMQPGGSFYKLVESYDYERRGHLHLDSFIAMCVQCNSVRRCFDLFDPAGIGQVAVDFNQLIWLMAQA